MKTRLLSWFAPWLFLGLCTAHAGPFVEQQEPVVVTEHQAGTGGRQVTYRARAGKLPIRDVGTGEIRAWMFYVAYDLKPEAGAKPRPVTFLWGGGPGGPSVSMDLAYFGPKQWRDSALGDNPASLLPVTDLVFIDAIGTGFSRVTKADFEKEFYTVRGDAASFAEFIRMWYALYANTDAPIYVGGASYGSWRSGIVTELLEKTGRHVAGSILLSGGILLGQDLLSAQEKAAYRVPAQAATALLHNRLDPSIGHDIDEVTAKANAWARDTYLPALRRINELSKSEREGIAQELSRYTGFPVDKIDRKVLAFSQPTYRSKLLPGGPQLDIMDMRRTSPQIDPPEVRARIGRYVREVLGYPSELAYAGVEQGYTSQVGPEVKDLGSRWVYDTGKDNKVAPSPLNEGLGPSVGEPWILRSIAMNPAIKVFVGAGLFDSMNTCFGNEASVRAIDADSARHMTTRCYINGHRMGVDPDNIARLATDVRAFIATPPIQAQQTGGAAQ
jgi:carboxypeptidase C (cathepsin A)